MLLLGDFNLDPYRQSSASVDVFNGRVGPPGSGREYTLLSGIVEHDPPYPTSVPLDDSMLDPTGTVTGGAVLYEQTSTIDHAAVRGGSGSCVTLGEAPKTERLDGGGGLDHRALSCTVQLEDAAPAGEGDATADEAGPSLPTTGGGFGIVAFLIGITSIARLRRPAV